MTLVRRFGTWAAVGAALVAGMGVGMVVDSRTTSSRHVLTNEERARGEDAPPTSTPAVEDVDEEAAPTPPPPDDTPPPLTVTSPAEGARLTEKTVRFEGQTEPGAGVTAGPYEADVDDGGRWSIVLVLSPGTNMVVFRAADAAGNVSEASVTLHYDAPPPPAEKPEDGAKVCPATLEGCEHDKGGAVCPATTEGCEHENDGTVCPATTEGCEHHEHDVCAAAEGGCKEA